MTEQEAIDIADRFMISRIGPNPRTADGPCTLSVIGARFSTVMERWTVVYRIIKPGVSVYDGDIIVVVNPETKEAVFFNDMWG